MKHPSLLVSRFGIQRFGLLLGAAFALAGLPGANAALNIKISEFIGFQTGDLCASNGGLEGWSATAYSTNHVTITNGSGSLDGTSLGLLASQGDKVYVDNTNALNAFCGFADANTFPTTASNKLYYSFLYKFHNATFTNGVQRIIQANRQNAGSQFTLQGVARTNNGQVQIGVVKNGGTVNWSPALINPGQVVFVVYRHQIIPPAGTPDVCDLWVNPAPVNFGVAEGSVPPPDATATDGTDDASNTGPGRFYVASGADAEFDELRISTNWAEVTPPVNICNGAGVSAPTPATPTVTADIRTSFSVVGSGTAVTYQWQISTNGGSTFNNIGGAGGANYATPPLATTDSGNQYRCITHVVCNNSSATSSVATVTVNPFVVTPVGVIMDDVWADTSRNGGSGNGQVDPSNSVFYSSSSILLDSSGGSLLGTTRSSNSILWVGYFTPTNNTPVHLAVGTGIKVTLPFRASNVESNSVNNSLRFGLFDYSDGGLRITADDFGNSSGSTGNGIGVLGYLWVQDFGTNFNINSPTALSARTTLNDTNLMGSSGDYTAVGSGPGAPLFLTNAPAFQSDTDYTLNWTVARSTANSTVLTASITGGGTNYTTTVTDTNLYYHRFDAIGIRPATKEATADSFNFSRLLVQVIEVPVPFNITSVSRPNASSAAITWQSLSGRTYQVQSRDSLSSGNWVSNATVSATGSSASYTNTGISAINTRYYRVVDLLP